KDVLCVPRRPPRPLMLMPFARDNLERILAAKDGLALPLLLRLRRIEAVGQLLSGLLTPLASFRQRHLRINAEGEALLLLQETILETPVAAAVGHHLQVHAAAIGVARRLGTWLGILTCLVAQQHFGGTIPKRSTLCPQKCPQN